MSEQPDDVLEQKYMEHLQNGTLLLSHTSLSTRALCRIADSLKALAEMKYEERNPNE